MQDKQFEIDTELRGNLDRRLARKTRQDDPTAYSLYSAEILTPFRYVDYPYRSAYQHTAVLLAVRQNSLVPDLKRNQVEFAGRIAGVIPAARRFLSFDSRTTYLLDGFRVTSSEPNVESDAFGEALRGIGRRFSGALLDRSAR